MKKNLGPAGKEQNGGAGREKTQADSSLGRRQRFAISAI